MTFFFFSSWLTCVTSQMCMVRDDESLWLRPRSQAPLCHSVAADSHARSTELSMTGSNALFPRLPFLTPILGHHIFTECHFPLQSGCRIIRGCLIINIYMSQWYQLAFYKTEDGTVPGMGHFEDSCYDNIVIKHQVRGWPRTRMRSYWLPHQFWEVKSWSPL